VMRVRKDDALSPGYQQETTVPKVPARLA
jgi:hypothetical protein